MALGLAVVEYPKPAANEIAKPRIEPLQPLSGKLAVLVVGLAIVNVLAAPILRGMDGGNDAMLIVAPAVIGILIGQVGAMACCLVFFPGPFVRRLLIHWGVTIVLSVAFVVG